MGWLQLRCRSRINWDNMSAALGAAFPAGMLKSKEEQKNVAKRLAAAADEIGRFGIRSSKEISNLAS